MKRTILTYQIILICSALILTVGTLIGGKSALIYFAIGLSCGVLTRIFGYICQTFIQSPLGKIPLDEISPSLALADCFFFMSLATFLGIILTACATGIKFTWLTNPIEIALALLTALATGLSLGAILAEWQTRAHRAIHSVSKNQQLPQLH